MKRLRAGSGMAAALLFGFLFLAAGCGKSGPTSFYALSGPQTPALSGGACLSLGVGPVETPAYLARNSLMIRDGENKLKLLDFEEWAEPVSDGLTRVLAENLGTLVCARPLVTYPWPAGVSPDYQITVQTQRFDGAPGKDVVLKATWAILDKNGELAAWDSFDGAEPAGGNFASMAAAMSRLAARLAGNMARALDTAVK